MLPWLTNDSQSFWACLIMICADRFIILEIKTVLTTKTKLGEYDIS